MTNAPLFGFGVKPISVGWSRSAVINVEIGSVNPQQPPGAGTVKALPFPDSKFTMDDDPNITEMKKIYDKTEKVTYLKTTTKHARIPNGQDGVSIVAGWTVYLPQIVSKLHSPGPIEFQIIAPATSGAFASTYYEAWRDWIYAPNTADEQHFDGYGQVSTTEARALWISSDTPWIEAFRYIGGGFFGNVFIQIPNPVAYPTQQDAQNFLDSIKYGLSSDTSTYGVAGPFTGPPEFPVDYLKFTVTTFSGKTQKQQLTQTWWSDNNGAGEGTATISIATDTTYDITASFTGSGWTQR